MSPDEMVQVVDTNNKTIFVISIIIGIVLLIIGIIWSYARFKSKTQIIRNKKRILNNNSFEKYDYDEDYYEDYELEDNPDNND